MKNPEGSRTETEDRIEEAISVLRRPENRIDDEAFANAWVAAYEKFSSEVNPDDADNIPGNPFCNVVAEYNLEKNELEPNQKTYFERRLQQKIRVNKDYSVAVRAGLPKAELKKMLENSGFEEFRIYFDYLKMIPEFQECMNEIADRFISLPEKAEHNEDRALSFAEARTIHIDDYIINVLVGKRGISHDEAERILDPRISYKHQKNIISLISRNQNTDKERHSYHMLCNGLEVLMMLSSPHCLMGENPGMAYVDESLRALIAERRNAKQSASKTQ